MNYCVICGGELHRDIEGMEVHCPELGMHWQDKDGTVYLKELQYE